MIVEDLAALLPDPVIALALRKCREELDPREQLTLKVILKFAGYVPESEDTEALAAFARVQEFARKFISVNPHGVYARQKENWHPARDENGELIWMGAGYKFFSEKAPELGDRIERVIRLLGGDEVIATMHLPNGKGEIPLPFVRRDFAAFYKTEPAIVRSEQKQLAGDMDVSRQISSSMKQLTDGKILDRKSRP